MSEVQKAIEAIPKAPIVMPEQAALAREKAAVKDKYADDKLEKPAALAAKEEQTEAKRAAEIQKMDKVLPLEQHERFDMRNALLELVSAGRMEQSAIPAWMYPTSTGDSLYQLGWRYPALQNDIILWRKWFEENSDKLP